MKDEPSTTVACTREGTSKLPKREVVLVNHPTSELSTNGIFRSVTMHPSTGGIVWDEVECNIACEILRDVLTCMGVEVSIASESPCDVMPRSDVSDYVEAQIDFFLF